MKNDVSAFTHKLIPLTQQANQDITKVKDLRDYLDENAPLLNDSAHTLAYIIARSAINHIARVGDDFKHLGQAEIIHREYKNVRAAFMGDDPSPVVKLLAERAALCWLRVQQAETAHTHIAQAGSVLISQVEHVEKRLTVAHNRFLRACDGLTKTKAMEEAILQMKARRSKDDSPAKQRLALVKG